MEHRILSLGIVLLVGGTTAFAQLAQQGHGWDIYGDRYPLFQRPSSEVSNFFVLEGPGNLNPGNFQDLEQNDPKLRIPSELKTYIARQFKYVLFDQQSFADYTGYNGSLVSMMTPVYHQEAESLMNRSSEIVVLPYFSFTLLRPQYPWRASVQESWFLHQAGQPADSSHRIRAVEGGFFLMDIGNVQWRSFYTDYIVGIRNAHTYRGIFLDNMSRYPWVHPADYDVLPAGVFTGWFDNLAIFLNDLHTALGSSVIICNSLGVDDNDPSTPPLYGPNHGTDLMRYAGGGALFESFHSTAWRSILDTTLAIMKYMRDNQYIFLGATYYHRGQDEGQVGEDVLPNRFGLEPATGWVSTSTELPSLKTFYRMQMSYLARSLLVTPLAGEPAFGYSFQPGVLLYQFIPYYRSWDERIGTPLENYFYNTAIHCYQREFSHSMACVNTSETLPVTISLPAGVEWYWYPYYGVVGDNNVDGAKVPGDSVTLNTMEGVVLFKKGTSE
jgi:hypothetical protein